jgi:hypothetical protein
MKTLQLGLLVVGLFSSEHTFCTYPRKIQLGYGSNGNNYATLLGNGNFMIGVV